MSQLLTYLESNSNLRFLLSFEQLLITDILNSYENVNQLEYE